MKLPGFHTIYNLSNACALSEDTFVPGPIIEADPVGFSFDAPGWYILGGLIFLALLVFSVRWLILFRKNAYRREAIRKVSAIDNPDELFTLLKSVALISFGRLKVAQLFGQKWLEFLESTGKATPFTNYFSILESVYNDCSTKQADLDALKEITIKWIRTHA